MSNITQKPERIASALYLITGFFHDQEPVKWKLRSLASDLVSISMSLISPMFKERETARLEIRSIVLEVKGLTTVAKNAGLISEANFNLLAEELLRYVENLGFPAGFQEENGAPVLSQSYFATSTEDKNLKLESGQKPAALPDKSEEKNLPYTRENLTEARENLSQGHKAENKYEKKGLLDDYELPAPAFKREEPREQRERPLKEFGAVSVKKNSRQSVIISLLKRKKEIMIKDVSPLISGCSEKTIQRELSAMVQAGILRKTGEKRWSRYSLA